MSWALWTAYAGAVLAMMSTPGPSQLLMMSNSMANGFARATATAAGDLSANVLQMLAAGLGLGALVAASESAFAAIKWAGVAYLVWMGVQKIRRAGAGRPGESVKASPRALFLQGFLTSAANPKAVVFFAALFPQFIDPHAPFWPQFLVLSATYIGLDAMFLAAYGGGAGWVAARLGGPLRRWIDRAAGAFLIVAAVLLGLRTAALR